MPILSAFVGTWRDGFGHPNLGDWRVHCQSGDQPIWRIENGLLLAEQSGCSGVWVGDDTWKNYSAEVSITLLAEKPYGIGTPDGSGAGIAMYWNPASWQGYFCGIYKPRWGGGEQGFYVDIGNGWRDPIASKHRPLEVEFDREYSIRVTEEEDGMGCYLDGELLLELEIDKRFTTGVVGPVVMNSRAYFGNFIVTGEGIPDGGPGM